MKILMSGGSLLFKVIPDDKIKECDRLIKSIEIFEFINETSDIKYRLIDKHYFIRGNNHDYAYFIEDEHIDFLIHNNLNVMESKGRALFELNFNKCIEDCMVEFQNFFGWQSIGHCSDIDIDFKSSKEIHVSGKSPKKNKIDKSPYYRQHEKRKK